MRFHLRAFNNQGFSNVPSALVPSIFFKEYLWVFLGPCVRGRGCTRYGTFAQPESLHVFFTARCAPRAVPSTFLLNYFWAFLGGSGEGRRGHPRYSTFAKPKGHFTEGMFEKCLKKPLLRNPWDMIWGRIFSRHVGSGVRKNGVCNRVPIDDVELILKFRMAFPFGKTSAGFARSVLLAGFDTEFPYRVRHR